MAKSIGSGWTTTSTKSRFETWFSNFKKMHHMCDHDGEGVTRWGLQLLIVKKDIQNIKAKNKVCVMNTSV